MTEVWRDAPVEGGDLLVLLALADAAGDDHRMAWLSVKTLARRSRMTERNVYYCLKNLVEAGIITDVDDSDVPVEAKHYSSAVRKITEAASWDPPANIAPLQPTSDNPISPVVSTKQVEELRSSPSPSRARGKGPKRAAPPVDDDDPQSHVLAALASDSPAPPLPEPRRPTLVNPLLPRKKRPRAQSETDKMVNLFATLARQNNPEVPGATNKAALRGSIGRWHREEGVDINVVRSMIEAYWSPTFQRSESRPAWQDFLAQRGSLVAQVAKADTATRAAIERHDASLW